MHQGSKVPHRDHFVVHHRSVCQALLLLVPHAFRDILVSISKVLGCYFSMGENFYGRCIIAKKKNMNISLFTVLSTKHKTNAFLHYRVIDMSKENRMQVHNIAIVFGPTLIWPEKESPNIAVNMVYQSRIVEYCLLEYKNIFRWGQFFMSSVIRHEFNLAYEMLNSATMNSVYCSSFQCA